MGSSSSVSILDAGGFAATDGGKEGSRNIPHIPSPYLAVPRCWLGHWEPSGGSALPALKKYASFKPMSHPPAVLRGYCILYMKLFGTSLFELNALTRLSVREGAVETDKSVRHMQLSHEVDLAICACTVGLHSTLSIGVQVMVAP